MLNSVYKLTTINMLIASKFTRPASSPVAWQCKQAIHFRHLASFEATATSWWSAARTTFSNPVAENFWYYFGGIARRKRIARMRSVSGAFSLHAPLPNTVWGYSCLLQLPYTHFSRSTSWVNIATQFRVIETSGNTAYLSFADENVFPTFEGLRYNEVVTYNDNRISKRVTTEFGGLNIHINSNSKFSLTTKCNIFRIYGLPAYIPIFSKSN